MNLSKITWTLYRAYRKRWGH